MQVPGTTREGGRLGFKTHLAPSTVPSQCDLECGPKVIPCEFGGLIVQIARPARKASPRVLQTSAPSTAPSKRFLECALKVIPLRGLWDRPWVREGLGFYKHWCPSTALSRCSLECIPKVFPWRTLNHDRGSQPSGVIVASNESFAPPIAAKATLPSGTENAIVCFGSHASSSSPCTSAH